MAGNYAQLLDIINNPTSHGLPAWDNNAKQIEGETIQQYLLYLIQSLTVGYQFMGVASTNTSGGTPDQNVFYIAGAGTYNGFGSNPITIDAGCLGIIIWNGAWAISTIKIADATRIGNFVQWGHKYGYEFMADVSNILTPSATQTGYIQPDGTIHSQSNWTTKKYDVENYPFVFATGSQAAPTTVYAALYDASDNLIKTIEIANGQIFNQYIYCGNAKYLRVNGNNSVLETTVCLPYSYSKVINLFGFGTDWQSVSTTGWKVGYVMYNTSTKLLRRCEKTNGTGGVSVFDTMPYQNDSIYVCNGNLYYYNGTELKPFQETIINNAIKTEDETILEVATSLYGDVIERISGADSPGIINADGTVSTAYATWTIYKYDVSDFDLVYVTGKSSSVSAVCATYDANDNVINVFDYGISGYIARNKPIIVRGAKYLRIEHNNADGVPVAKQVRQILPDIPVRNNLANKVVAFIGDSITAGGTPEFPVDILYHKIFADKYGCINRNLGVWSTCIAHDTNSEYASQYFATRATAQNLADCALIVVFGGTNDFTYDKKPIGDLLIEESQTPTTPSMGNKKLVANSDVDCFSGAVHNLINTIRTAAPSVPILFMTPLKKNRGGVSSIQFNAQGNTLQEFTNAIKTICEFYAIPVFDCGGMSELDFMNADIATTYSGDGLHPNAAGHKLLGNLLFRFVENNIFIE